MSALSDYESLKRRADRLAAEIQRDEGALEAIQAQMLDSHGVRTLEEALALERDLARQVSAKEQQLGRDNKELESQL